MSRHPFTPKPSKYDSKLLDIEGLRFLPWIGDSYHANNRFGLKLLVLGESHYEDAPDFCPDDLPEYYETRYVTHEYTRNEKHRFWTNIGQTLAGESYEPETRSKLWEEFAFYNYIQEFVGDKSRIAPTGEMWEKAKQPFFSLMRILRPEFVLVLGERLWNKLPGEEREPIVHVAGEDHARKTCLIPVGRNANCLAARIYHPSTGFSSERWHRWTRKYLQLAKR